MSAKSGEILKDQGASPRSAATVSSFRVTARANAVNRTHRIVRQRAQEIQASRTTMRGLLLPMLLCSTLMLTLVFAVWMLLDQYDLVSSELPSSIHHFFLLLLWFLPVSAGLVAMVWFRRGRDHADAEAAQ